MSLQVLLPYGSPLAAALPRGLAEALADRGGDVAALLARRLQATLGHNHHLVTGRSPTRATRRGAFRSYARYYLGAMRLAHRGLDAALGPCQWDGIGALDASLARGRGALIVSAHLGHWDLLGFRLAERYGPICVFVEELRPRALFDFYTRLRSRHGMKVVPVGAPSRWPIEQLRRNGIVAVTADRPFGSRSASVAAERGTLEIPVGAMRLALRAGAPVHGAFALRERDGFRLVVGPDWSAGLDPRRPIAENVHHVATQYVARLRDLLGRHPDQWCMMQALGSPSNGNA